MMGMSKALHYLATTVVTQPPQGTINGLSSGDLFPNLNDAIVICTAPLHPPVMLAATRDLIVYFQVRKE